MTTHLNVNETSTELLNFNVTMLGASGSGKTVFLASMLHELSIQGDRGFFLRVDDQNLQKFLTQAYGQLVTGEKWPKGNDREKINKWEFTCFVQSKKDCSIFPACRFTYLDYAGSNLTDYEEGDEEYASDLDNAIQDSHILIGLLDGGKLLRAMQGDQAAWNSLIFRDLTPILHKMQSSKVCIHFVISKWDLLQDQFSLGEVRERLLEYPKFKELIKARNEAGQVIRLIPVSSVGEGFAILQEDGGMKKTGKFPEPFQVEMPLACIVPDLIENSLDLIRKQREQIEQPVKDAKANVSLWDKTLRVATKAFDVMPLASGFAQMFIPGAGTLLELGDFLFDWLDLDELLLSGVNKKREDAEKQTEALRQQQDEQLKLVESKELAFKHTVTSFVCLRNLLDMEFPDSRLKV